MKKWSNIFYSDFLEVERTNCYWFWFKGKFDRRRDKETLQITETHRPIGKWVSIRHKNGFYNCFDELTKKYMSGKWNGQTKAEFAKNYKRVKDIIDKSEVDVEKATRLARTQANRITDEWKALNRSLTAKEMGYEEIFEVFFQRAYELGSVSKQDYRAYKLEKLGL
jgi:hypothetical protein